MTIVYDMAAGSIRSDAQHESRNEKQQDNRPEIIPDYPGARTPGIRTDRNRTRPAFTWYGAC